MRHFSIFVIILLATTPVIHAQNSVADSLNKLIETEKKDTSKVLLLNKLAIIFQNSNPDTSLAIAGQSFKLARTIGFKKGEGNSLNITGNVNRVKGNLPQALEAHLAALAIREEINDRRGVGVSYLNIGSIHSELGDEQEALESILKAKSMAEAIGSKDLLLAALTNGSDSYEKLDKLDSAWMFAHEGRKMAVQQDNDEMKGLCLNNLGNINARWGKKRMAMYYYKESIPPTEAVQNDETLCEANLGIAALYYSDSLFELAFPYAQKAYSIALKNGFAKRIIEAGDFLADYYDRKNLTTLAHPYLKKNIALRDSTYGLEKARKVQVLLVKEQKRQKEMETKNDERKKNMQIIGIAAFIPLFFGIVLMLSKRKAEPALIKFLGLLGLLLLFEFIALFVHPHIEHLSGHKPVLMLLGLVCIASVLVPLHHKLEKWVTQRLAHKDAGLQKADEEIMGSHDEQSLYSGPDE